MTTDKIKTIADLITDLENTVATVKAITFTGSVQYFDATTLFVGRDCATGLLHATWITNDEMEACAYHGIGIPAYTNGKGDKSRIITMEQAKAFEIASLEKGIATLNELLAHDGEEISRVGR